MKSTGFEYEEVIPVNLSKAVLWINLKKWVSSNFSSYKHVVDMEDKKQPINIKNTNSNTIDVKRINLLLKYLDNVLNSSRKSFFLDKHLLKLHKNLKDILKFYK